MFYYLENGFSNKMFIVDSEYVLYHIYNPIIKSNEMVLCREYTVENLCEPKLN